MTPLRQRMIEDMRIRNFTEQTQTSYCQYVSQFARHFRRSPERLGPEEIRTYQHYLVHERKLSASSLFVAVGALRFLYKVTLKKDWPIETIIPTPKRQTKLPVVLSQDEVQRLLDAVAIYKHRVILTTCYAAGLRISEAIRLTPLAIDSERMTIRIDQGKGRQDRYVMLSPRLLQILREWYRAERPKHWLFPGDIRGTHVTHDAVEKACKLARQRCGITKPVTPHSLRHCFAVHLLEAGTDVRTIQLLLGPDASPLRSGISISLATRSARRRVRWTCSRSRAPNRLHPPRPRPTPPRPDRSVIAWAPRSRWRTSSAATGIAIGSSTRCRSPNDG